MSPDILSSTTALWWAVVLSGFYHGINPGMGWPLAVSAGLMKGRHQALPFALFLLAVGHLAAMLIILLPFSLLTGIVQWEREIRITAGFLVIGMGLYLLINRRHPKMLARVHPSRLALWSFLAALAHGAGLMLVPIYLQLCRVGLDAGHDAALVLMQGSLSKAVVVSLIHTLAMTFAGGVLATLIYFWLGLKFLSKTWFNLDVVWALSLIIVGILGTHDAWH